MVATSQAIALDRLGTVWVGGRVDGRPTVWRLEADGALRQGFPYVAELEPGTESGTVYGLAADGCGAWAVGNVGLPGPERSSDMGVWFLGEDGRDGEVSHWRLDLSEDPARRCEEGQGVVVAPSGRVHFVGSTQTDPGTYHPVTFTWE